MATLSKWIPPSIGLLKLNFDGASKGNPGDAGYGGIFRDHKGNPLLIFYGSICWDSNNSAELEGLWQGLCLAQIHNYFPIEIEGDSQILINMVNQLLMGFSSSKVADSWRLMARLDLIADWLQQHRAISFKHVKRFGNKVANLLANKGVTSSQILTVGPLTILNDNNLIQECTNLVHEDNKPPDVGV